MTRSIFDDLPLTPVNCIGLVLLWLLSSAFFDAALQPFLPDVALPIRVSSAALAGLFLLVVLVTFILIALELVVVWLVFSVPAYLAISLDPAVTPWLATQLALSLGVGLGTVLALVAAIYAIDFVMTIWDFFRLTPAERLASRIASGSTTGEQERESLMSRLIIVAESPQLRELCHYDQYEAAPLIAGYWDVASHPKQHTLKIEIRRRDLKVAHDRRAALADTTPLCKTVFRDPRDGQFWLASYWQEFLFAIPALDYTEDPVTIRVTEDLRPIDPTKAQVEISLIEKRRS